MSGANPNCPAYSAELKNQAQKLARLGCTDYEIYEFLGISKPTFYRWRLEHPEFATAIKVGKTHANERVEAALYHRAVGYTYNSEKIVVLSDGQGEGSHVERVAIVEHVPPDVKAAQYWLNNRKPHNWATKQEVTHDGTVKFDHVQRDDKDLDA